MSTFRELNLIAPLQQAVADEEYTSPTPIQLQAIPPAVKGRDVLGCAQTGTGKTAAFALPILNRLGQTSRRANPNRPCALVLAPTRELAIQIGQSLATYGRHLRLRHLLVYGGVNQRHQVRSLNRGAHIVVATPGRLLDLIEQGHISLESLEVFVLDEADRMLDMGFLPDIRRLSRMLPPKRQSLFFSATMPPKIVDLSGQLLKRPVKVSVTPESVCVERIRQCVLIAERPQKLHLLRQLLAGPGVERALVFTRTKRGADVLTRKLGKSDIAAVAIHGNRSQNARQRALEAFRNNDVQVLVATDVAARGIDIESITHIVNFDMPVEPGNYVHRIGRTGRAGEDGVAVSFCSSNERSELRAIERLIGHRIPIVTGLPEPGDPSERETTSSTDVPRSTIRSSASDKRPSVISPSRTTSGGNTRPKKRRQRRRRQRPNRRERSLADRPGRD